MGERLRESFKSKLQDVGVEVHCNFEVKSLEECGEDRFRITSTRAKSFDAQHVINATSYQALLSEKPLSSFFNIDIVYQPCLALVYKYFSPLPAPLSFIVMDGAFPSLTRYDNRVYENEPFSYVLTHVVHSMLEPCATPEEAQKRLSTIGSDINEVRRKCELAIKEYYPEFDKEFMYLNYESAVLAKLVTDEAFRGAFVIRDPRGVIVTFPGKISHIPKVAAEAEVLMEKNLEQIINRQGFWFVKDGMFDRANTSLFSKSTRSSNARASLFFPPSETIASNQSIAPSINERDYDFSL